MSLMDFTDSNYLSELEIKVQDLTSQELLELFPYGTMIDTVVFNVYNSHTKKRSILKVYKELSVEIKNWVLVSKLKDKAPMFIPIENIYKSVLPPAEWNPSKNLLKDLQDGLNKFLDENQRLYYVEINKCGTDLGKYLLDPDKYSYLPYEPFTSKRLGYYIIQIILSYAFMNYYLGARFHDLHYHNFLLCKASKNAKYIVYDLGDRKIYLDTSILNGYILKITDFDEVEFGTCAVDMSCKNLTLNLLSVKPTFNLIRDNYEDQYEQDDHIKQLLHFLTDLPIINVNLYELLDYIDGMGVYDIRDMYKKPLNMESVSEYKLFD